MINWFRFLATETILYGNIKNTFWDIFIIQIDSMKNLVRDLFDFVGYHTFVWSGPSTLPVDLKSWSPVKYCSRKRFFIKKRSWQAIAERLLSTISIPFTWTWLTTGVYQSMPGAVVKLLNQCIAFMIVILHQFYNTVVSITTSRV